MTAPESKRQGERGTMTLLGIGLSAMLLFVGGFSLDLWRHWAIGDHSAHRGLWLAFVVCGDSVVMSIEHGFGFDCDIAKVMKDHPLPGSATAAMKLPISQPCSL